MRWLALLALIATPAAAGVEEAVKDHALPATACFAKETADLASAARLDCRADALRPAYHVAFDAWMGLGHLRLGPLETEGRALAIAFWPDTRGMVPAAVARLIAEADPAVASPEAFAEVSVAARGLFALERLLFEPDFAGYGENDYACDLVQAIAADLARMAGAIEAEWRTDYAEAIRTA